MKKKFISLVLAVLVPFSSANVNYCSALKNNDNLDKVSEEQVQMLKERVRELEKEQARKNTNNSNKPSAEDMKMLQEKLKKLADKKSEKLSVWEVAKFVVVLGLGIYVGRLLIKAILIGAGALFAGLIIALIKINEYAKNCSF